MENIDISKIKEKKYSPQTKKLLKIYLEGIQNKSKCPPSSFNIIITIIIFIAFITEHLLKILFFIIFFIFLNNNPKNYDKKKKKYHF